MTYCVAKGKKLTTTNARKFVFKKCYIFCDQSSTSSYFSLVEPLQFVNMDIYKDWPISTIKAEATLFYLIFFSVWMMVLNFLKSMSSEIRICVPPRVSLNGRICVDANLKFFEALSTYINLQYSRLCMFVRVCWTNFLIFFHSSPYSSPNVSNNSYVYLRTTCGAAMNASRINEW